MRYVDFDSADVRAAGQAYLRDMEARLGRPVTLADFDVPKAAPAPNYDRSWLQAAGDTGAQLMEGVANIGGAIPNLVAPNSAVARMFNDSAQWAYNLQSDAMKNRIARAEERIAQADPDSAWQQAWEAVKAYASDPAMIARLGVTNAASVIPAASAAKGVQALSLARGASKAKAATNATIAAGGVNAALNAGGARGDAYAEIGQAAIDAGYTQEQARQAALDGSRWAAGVGAVTGALSGATGLESAIVRGGLNQTGRGAFNAGLRGAATEFAGELGEELLPQVATNWQAGQYDGRPLTRDLGRTAVETLVATGPFAGVAGVAAGRNQRRANLAAPDKTSYGLKNSIGRDLIVHMKKMDDGTTLYLEEIRTKRGTLALQSMRKYPLTTSAASIEKTLRPTSETLQGDARSVANNPASPPASPELAAATQRLAELEVLAGMQPLDAAQASERDRLTEQVTALTEAEESGLTDAPEPDTTPTESVFGPVYTQFRGDTQAAIAHLIQQRTGEAEAALHHPEVGNIDLVWGREGTAEKDYRDGFGVAKLAKKHPEVLGDLQGFITGLKKNEARSGKNRIRLDSPTGEAAVRLDWDGKHKKWLMTAFARNAGTAATGGRTSVTDHAESAPPADQGAIPNPAATGRRTSVTNHAESAPPADQGAGLGGDSTTAGARARPDAGKFGERARRDFLRAIRQSGGISAALASDIYGERAHMANRRVPGLFRRDGMAEDTLAELMQQHGYLPMDASTVDLASEALGLVRDALDGEPVYTLEQMDEAARLAYAEREAEEMAAYADEAARNNLPDFLVDLFDELDQNSTSEETAEASDAIAYLRSQGITDESTRESIIERAAIRADDSSTDFFAEIESELAAYRGRGEGVQPRVGQSREGSGGEEGGAGQNLRLAQPTPDGLRAADEAAIQSEGFRQWFGERTVEQLEAEYQTLPGTYDGRIIDADRVRELAPAYRANKARSAELHPYASALTKVLFARALARPVAEGRAPVVAFLAGGGGSGKSTAGGPVINRLNADIVLDGTFSNLNTARANIKAALASKRKVAVVYVYRSPEKSARGAVERAIAEGRPVPVDVLAEAHAGAAQTIKALAQEYNDSEDVAFRPIWNDGKVGDDRPLEIKDIPHVDQQQAEQTFRGEVESAREAGKLTSALYRSFVEGMVQVGRLDTRHHRGSEQTRPEQYAPDTLTAARASTTTGPDVANAPNSTKPAPALTVEQAGQRWDDMDITARRTMARASGIHPAQKNTIHNTPWGQLAPKIRASLAAAMRAQQPARAATNTKTSGDDVRFARNQQNATKTPAFKVWFGNSKVVDAKGQPLLVYHSTGEQFNVFDIEKSRSWKGAPDYDLPGFYFTADQRESADYGDRTITAYLSLQNPFTGDMREYKQNQRLKTWRETFDALQREGYDGVIDNGDGSIEYIAFKPESIKSATQNRGTFDPDNPDIRYSKYDKDDTRAQIQAVIEAARQPGHAPQKAVLGKVSDWLAGEATKHGLNLQGFVHTLDGSALRNIIKNHYDAKAEKSRGLIALTDSDVRALPSLLKDPDAVVLGTKNRLGREQIAYVKRMPDGSTLYLEEVRTGREELAAVSARKYPATMDAGKIISTLHPNARSDSGNGVIVLTPPEAGKRHAIARVESTVASISKHWHNGPDVVVAHDMADAAIPQAVRDADAEQKSQKPRFTIAREGVAKAEAERTLAELAGQRLRNRETGIDAFINSNQAGKLISNAAVHKSEANGFTREQHYAITEKIETLWEDAVQVAQSADKNNQPGIHIKRFVTPILIGGQTNYVVITAKATVQHGHRIYSLEAHAERTLRGMLDKAGTENGMTLIPSRSVDSIIKSLDALVKPGTQSAKGEVEGFYHDGKVYLLASELKTDADTLRVLYHEVLGHFGLRGAFGNSLNAILDQIIQARPDLIRAKVDQYGLDADLRGKRHAAEEVLAEMAQTSPGIGYVQRAVAAIRTWLRTHVPAFRNLRMSDAEIIRDFLLPAREFVLNPYVAQRRDIAVDAETLARMNWPFDLDNLPPMREATTFSEVREAAKAFQGEPLVNVQTGMAAVLARKSLDKMLSESAVAKSESAAIQSTAVANADSLFERAIWGWSKPDRGADPNIIAVHRFFAPMGVDGRMKMVKLTVKETRHSDQNNPLYTLEAVKFDDADQGLQWLQDAASEDDISLGEKIPLRGERAVEIAVSKDNDPKTTRIGFLPQGSAAEVIVTLAQELERRNRGGARFSRKVADEYPTQTVSRGLYQRLKSLISPDAIDNFLYKYQDKFIDLKRIQADIAALNDVVADTHNAYRGEELYHKRVAKRTANFLRDEVKPLLAAMNAAGVDMAQFEAYLHARHAPEANAAMAARNLNEAQLAKKRQTANALVDDLQTKLERARRTGTATTSLQQALAQAQAEQQTWRNAQAFKGTEAERLSLSGMSDEEAAKILAGYTGERKAAMDALAARVDKINAATLRTLQDYGLEDVATLNTWRNTYRYYVPLHRDEAHADARAHPVGQGFSVRGAASRQRVGSNQKVTNILGHVVMQREAALTRGEKNLVAKRLYLLAASHQDDSLWRVDSLPKKKIVDDKTGLVKTVPDPQAAQKNNVVAVRVGGRDRHIVFNERNERALRLAMAVKNLDAHELNDFVRTMQKITRWFASVNTQYNPVFGLVNLTRDTQAALLQLSNTPLAGKQREVFKHVRANMGAIWRDLRQARKGEQAAGEWARLWEQLQLDGGTTGYRDLYADPADRAHALQRALDEMGQTGVGRARAAGQGVLNWLSDFNETLENTTRLATYKAALDNGLTREHAASLAKNITVNFNRKGERTALIGSFYAFFNAAVQGNARMLATLTGPAGKRIVLGGVALGMVMEMAGRLIMGAGDDDEWDKIPDFIKERSLIIALSPKDYIAIPMPLGFHVLTNLGRTMVSAALHDDPTHGRGGYLTDLAMTIIDAYNPLGGADNVLQMATPTPFDPIVAVATNRDWTGRPIYRESYNGLSPQPGHARAKDAASAPARWMARLINAASGGNEWRPGSISPTPEALEYLFGQVTGGVGRELTKVGNLAASLATGEELPAHRWVVAGRFYGNTRGVNGQSERYFEHIKAANVSADEAEGRRARGEAAQAIARDVPLARLSGTAKLAEKRRRELLKIRQGLQASQRPESRARVQAVNAEIEALMGQFNRLARQAARAEQR